MTKGGGMAAGQGGCVPGGAYEIAGLVLKLLMALIGELLALAPSAGGHAGMLPLWTLDWLEGW